MDFHKNRGICLTLQFLFILDILSSLFVSFPFAFDKAKITNLKLIPSFTCVLLLYHPCYLAQSSLKQITGSKIGTPPFNLVPSMFIFIKYECSVTFAWNKKMNIYTFEKSCVFQTSSIKHKPQKRKQM